MTKEVRRLAPEADPAVAETWFRLRSEPSSALSSMGSPCFQLHETRELAMKFEEEG
jgi:hypothetical protein